jgi:hypothetical protein
VLIALHPAALVGLLLATSLSTAVFVAVLVRARPPAAAPPALAAGQASSPLAYALPPGAGVALVAEDPARVDFADVIAQAASVALGVEPLATSLVVARATDLRGGLLDATRSSAAFVVFSYHQQDSARPPGQDIVSGTVTVSVDQQRLTPSRNDHHEQRGLGQARPCSSQRAFQAAVDGGLPGNAITTMTLIAIAPSDGEPRLEWHLSVEGHNELERRIDALSCAPVAARAAHLREHVPFSPRRRPAATRGSPAPDLPIDSFP